MIEKTLIRFEDVVKSYRLGKIDVPVLEHLNFEVAEGDFVVIMGPSGSGKTTLLNLLGGLDQPTSGRIVVDGEEIAEMSARQMTKWRARHVGFVFQAYHLLPVLSAHRNVELPLLLTGLSRAQRKFRVETALDIVGLASRGRHKPAELSGGQQQRVAIARAIVSDPSLLICDEPTGNLDRAGADETLSLLQMLNSEHGKTIVMVTHDPKAAEFAQRTVHMDKGRFSVPGEIAS